MIDEGDDNSLIDFPIREREIGTKIHGSTIFHMITFVCGCLCVRESGYENEPDPGIKRSICHRFVLTGVRVEIWFCLT